LSEIRANTVSDAAGTGPVTLTKQSAAKAWVNFNGTGAIAARDSFNVSSLTDIAVGGYSANYTNALAAGGYALTPSTGITSGSADIRVVTTGIVAASCTVQATNGDQSSVQDNDVVIVSIHGDLA
jgi:hypothetical protein